MINRSLLLLCALACGCSSTGTTDGGNGGGSATGGGAAGGGSAIGGGAAGGGSATGGGTAHCGALAESTFDSNPCYSGCSECNQPGLLEGDFVELGDSSYLSSACGQLNGRVHGALTLHDGGYENVFTVLTGMPPFYPGDPLTVRAVGSYTANGQTLHVVLSCVSYTLPDGGPGNPVNPLSTTFETHFVSSSDGGELVLGGSGAGGGTGAGSGGVLYGKQ
ncbi:MAG: hypothetical protein QM723_18645 [Myxococcaceae bacterium]